MRIATLVPLGSKSICMMLLALLILSGQPIHNVSAQTEPGTGTELTCESLTFPGLLAVAASETAVRTVDAGSETAVEFSLRNTSMWDIVNTTITLALVQNGGDDSTQVYPTIASTILLESVTLRAGETRSLEGVLNVPPAIDSGTYELVLVAAQSKADAERQADAVAAAEFITATPVYVQGNEKILSVNALQYEGASVNEQTVVELSDRTTQEIALTIENIATSTPVRGTLTWQLYEGNLPNQAALVSEASEEIKLIPGASKEHRFNLETSVENPSDVVDISVAKTLLFDEYVLLVSVKEEDTLSQRFLTPIRFNDSDTRFSMPSVSRILVAREGGATNVLACVPPEYLSDERLPFAMLLAATAAGEEIDMHLLTNDEERDPLLPLRLQLPGTESAPRITLSVGRGYDGELEVPALSRTLLSEVTLTIPCDIHACVTASAGSEDEATVSPLQTWVGGVILIIIASLPLIGAYQVMVRSRRRRTPAPHPIDEDRTDQI